MPAAVAIPAIATVVGGGLAAGAAVAGSRSAQRTQREASRMENDATMAALADAREQRAYEQRLAEEDRAYERGRYAEDRDYTRAKYADERDFDRGQFANYLGRLDPYAKVGANAVTGLASSLPSVASVRPTMGRMVKVQAPMEHGGEIREVPEAYVQQLVSKGGRVVR
jgi:hypothetical protein